MVLTSAGVLDMIARLRAMAVVRTETAEQAVHAAEACVRGGVESNLIAYLEAGAFAFGLGGSLIDRASVGSGDWAAIAERASRVAAMVARFEAAHEGRARP